MKYLKILGLAAVAAMAMMAIGASTASATTLEIGGVATAAQVEINASLASGTSAKLQKTDGTFANTCTASTVVGKTEKEKTTGATVSGPISSLTFTSCTNEKVVVDKPGSLSIERVTTIHRNEKGEIIGETPTNGTVKSSGAEVTVPSPFGSLNCKTGEGTDIGTLTGVASGHATMDIKAVLNCGFLAPSATWEGTYTVTSPTGLGVTN